MLKLLRDNAYNRADANDAIDHITRYLEIMDIVRIQSVDPEQLRIFAFPYSLTDNAHKWWMHEVNHMITSWEELVNKFFYKYYLLSHASKTNDANVRECHLRFINWLSSKFKNPWKLSIATKNALWKFWEKGYDNTTLYDDEESSDDDDNKSNHINHHDINPLLDPYPSVKDEVSTSISSTKRTKGGPYTAPSRSPDEEEKRESNYGVTCEDEAKRRNSWSKTKTFEENCYLLLYAVSNKEDTAYQRHLITRIRVMINSLYGVSLFTYTPYAQLVIS
ncbi:hypothetical protein Tco_0534827 [Tanacetum coccineum]